MNFSFPGVKTKGGTDDFVGTYDGILDDASLGVLEVLGTSSWNKFLEQVLGTERRVEFLGFIIPLGVGVIQAGYTVHALGPSLVDQQFHFSLKQR
jgi:hypothetical protein